MRTRLFGPLALVAASYAGLALSSALAVWMLNRTFAEMAVSGGGIAAVSIGMWQATQLPLVSAWMAMLAALIAVAWVVRGRQDATAEPGRAARPVLVLGAAGVAIASGVAPVVLFDRTLSFILREINPNTAATGLPAWDVIPARLAMTAAVSAGCFVLLMVLAAVTIRAARRSAMSRQLRLVAAIALVISFGVSAALAVNLRQSSNRFRTIAAGGPLASR